MLGLEVTGIGLLCSVIQQSDISDTCHEIFEFIKRGSSSKRAIFPTACSVQHLSYFVCVEHILISEQLAYASQTTVLDKTIYFQGCEVTIRSVLQRHGIVQHVLGPELVTDLITEGTAVNIGGRLQVNVNYSAVRVLEMKTLLLLKFLREANYVFALSVKRREDLLDIVTLDKTVQSFCLEEINMKHFREDKSRFFFFSKSKMWNIPSR